MGFHICPYCEPDKTYRFSHLSSGDTTLIFTNGRSWTVPDMILHYVADHGWLPPAAFIEDVMTREVDLSDRAQTKGLSTPVGYLMGPFEKGEVPPDFVKRLEILLSLASATGHRLQYRSL